MTTTNNIPTISGVTKDITDYLSSQRIGYDLSWDGSKEEPEISFWIGDMKYTFRYFEGKWIDMNEYVLENIKCLMRL